MRESFGRLTQQGKDICIDNQSASYNGLSDTPTFIKREINNTVMFLFSLLKEYKLQPAPRTASTVVGQTYYSYPPDFSKLESITVNLGSNTPALKVVHSQAEWDKMQQVVTTGFPTSVFPRQYDFGLYPKPQAAYTMTLNGNYNPVNMTADDYSTGTVTVTINDATITGLGTTFTSNMVDRWFVLTSDGIPSGNWYKIASYTSGTSLELATTFSEASGSAQTYMIVESPDIPPELHEFIPYRVGANYYALRRRDTKMAKELLNFFYTGDYDNPNRRGNIKGGILAVLNDLKQKGRGNSQLLTMGQSYESNIIRDGIWSTTLTAP